MTAFLKSTWGIVIIVVAAVLLVSCCMWTCWRKCRGGSDDRREPRRHRRRRYSSLFSDGDSDDEEFSGRRRGKHDRSPGKKKHKGNVNGGKRRADDVEGSCTTSSPASGLPGRAAGKLAGADHVFQNGLYHEGPLSTGRPPGGSWDAPPLTRLDMWDPHEARSGAYLDRNCHGSSDSSDRSSPMSQARYYQGPPMDVVTDPQSHLASYSSWQRHHCQGDNRQEETGCEGHHHHLERPQHYSASTNPFGPI